MDNFREWLSDNLRYILLGAAVLVVLIVIFVGIRILSGASGKSQSNTSDNHINTESEEENPSSDSAQVTQMPVKALEKDAVPEVTELVKQYYKILGSKDVEALKQIVDHLDPAEESKIANTKYIEDYENVEVYTTAGLEDGTYVVFASFAYKCADVDTPAPALSQMYVVTDENGKLWISADAINDRDIQTYVGTILNQPEVVQLRNNVQAAYDQAQANDPQLKAFLESLGGADTGTPIIEDTTSGDGIDGQGSNSSGEGMMTAVDDCNVRMAAQSGSEVLTVVPAGEQVSKIGEEGGWVQVEYNGVVGYVYQDLLQ